MTHTKEPWVAYTDRKPQSAGIYEWRMPSAAVEGAVVLVAAHMRKRGAGYVLAISPTFDYWDGYRLHVPRGLEWRPTSEHQGIKSYEVKIIGIEGLEHAACIYCGKVPRLHAVQRARDGGVVVSGDPNRLNSWWLECCAWGKTPHLGDPREIERIRRAAFARTEGRKVQG